jgi:glycosyltransferase involved in cell wall biosynthesis
VRVLYVNHTSVVGGGERSLLDLLECIREVATADVACPPGPLAHSVRRLGLSVHEIRGTDVSFRLHPVRTPRGVAQLAAASVDVGKLLRRQLFDVVHANSTRSGLIAAPTGLVGSTPLVVHVRDTLPPGATGSLTRAAVGAAADVVLANSEYTARSFSRNGSSGRVHVVHNAVDGARFDPARVDRRRTRSELGIGGEEPLIGVVGQITPWKAQDDAVRVLADVRRRGLRARLLVVGRPQFVAGSERYDNKAFSASVEQLAGELGVAESVLFLGEREDVPELLGALDVLIVPSWEEPFGRVVVEAMSMCVPVIATDVGGPAEIVQDGEDGILLPPRSPARWGEAAFSLLSDSERRTAIGRRARETVGARFSPERHVAAVLGAYREAMSP